MIKQALAIYFLSLALFLGSYRGYLALFEKDAAEPTQIFPCKVETLPKSDQKLLEQRIKVRSAEEMDQILEDYLS